MKKITSFKIANELVNKMIEAGEEIVLWDDCNSNRVVSVNEDNEGLLEVLFIDTVNDEVCTRDMYRSELATVLFENRKYVNRLNDLASL